MPESVVQEELATLGISVQGVMQLRSGRRSQDCEKDRSLTTHFIVSVPRGPVVIMLRSLTELCGSRWRRTLHQRALCCQRLGHTQRNCGYTSRCVACGEAHQ